MISFGSCIYPTLGSVKVSPSRVASPENYKHQTLKVSGVTPVRSYPQLPYALLLMPGDRFQSRLRSLINLWFVGIALTKSWGARAPPVPTPMQFVFCNWYHYSHVLKYCALM